ncbi:heparinase II/III family protein [Brevundimonas terrae]|uniref:Heparinase II/III family protein n=1 Tax=Brevundimonas terrae TaxID=363631 RepID=A0ABN0Y1T7_9CAUL|nr:heparinase II/III family protein [Brevundimonas terrae]NIJ26038.1 putative heparinase superfamily protein [Brevundimonas terrae]
MKPIGPFAPRDSETPLAEGHIPGLKGAPVRTPMPARGIQHTSPAMMGAIAKALLSRQLWIELYGLPGYGLTLGNAKAQDFALSPKDLRPVPKEAPRPLLGGKLTLMGLSLETDHPRQMWDQPTPNRAFAVELHSFNWLPAMMAQGERGLNDALEMTLGWLNSFADWSPFSWSPDILARRVYNLACAAKRLSQHAEPADRQKLANSLARQTKQLLRPPHSVRGRAERLTAAAVAGCALGDPVGSKLLHKALKRLPSALDQTVLADGSHASRSAEQGLELLLDLLTLDDALSQRSLPTPPEVASAISRLTIALRSQVLPDGRLSIFQGGGPSSRERIAAARAHDETPAAPPASVVGGIVRVSSPQLTLLLDVEAPAAGAWSVSACGQPAALELLCGKDRLFTSAGWTPRFSDRHALRLSAGASTLTLGERPIGEPLSGWKSELLGPRLDAAPLHITRDHQQTDTAIWLEVEHDGWMPLYGLMHQRRIYIDQALDEIRAEECLLPKSGHAAPERIAAPYALRFQLDPDVQASVARDRRSILLRGKSGKGWWFRSDGPDIAVETAVHVDNGLTRRSLQIVVRGSARTDAETKIRWKLAAASED